MFYAYTYDDVLYSLVTSVKDAGKNGRRVSEMANGQKEKREEKHGYLRKKCYLCSHGRAQADKTSRE
ncbi:hypothetical protein SAMN02745202_02190 [Segatella oulorum]|uniref:Uncharacterized protein n=1 Tax=Segatella oulorum TaxID=28136 RepID=A0A1T4RCD0_9BACT|nr:hypothetical protein SAMN02745202_02190 [Segatella oulorum]